MSSNPDQIPKSSESNVPHSGEYVSPEAVPIEPGITAPDTVYNGFEELPPRTDERHALDQGKAAVRDSHEVQPKKKFSLGAKIGALAAAAAAAAGIAYGVNVGATGNGFIQKPAPLPTAEGPAVPGQTAPAVPEATAPVTPEQNADAKNFKFYTGEGDKFQTVADLKESLKLDVDKYTKPADTIPLVIERMADAANYLPTEKAVRENLNKPTEQLSIDDYMAVYNEYLKAHDVMFNTKGGDLYDTLQEVCKQTAYSHIISVANGEAVPYAVKIELHTNNTGLRISDNSLENGIDDNAFDYLGNYRLLSSGLNDVVSNNGAWSIAGNMELIKQAK